MNTENFRAEYAERKDGRDWKLQTAKEDVEKFQPIAEAFLYRPFDIRYTLYTGTTKGIHAYPRLEIMKHMRTGKNLGLILGRQNKSGSLNDFLVTKFMSEMKTGERTIQSYHAPLYLYPDENDLDQTRRVNMEPKIRAAIERAATHPKLGAPDEVQIFDYIYGVLHCPAYRETYAEFLKIDFPRVPYPSSPEAFWDISAKGKELRTLHLMDGVDAGLAYPFRGEAPEGGSGFVGTIGKKSYQMSDETVGNVLINETQFFEGVPLTAWEFYIGGYQPAQKWLKDRKGRTLFFDDRMHYRKIIHILMETDRIMKMIEMGLA